MVCRFQHSSSTQSEGRFIYYATQILGHHPLPQPNQQPKTTYNNFCWCGMIIGKNTTTPHTTTTPQKNWRMEDNQNFLLNGRLRQLFSNGRRLQHFQMEDDLNVFVNGRQPPKIT